MALLTRVFAVWLESLLVTDLELSSTIGSDVFTCLLLSFTFRTVLTIEETLEFDDDIADGLVSLCG